VNALDRRQIGLEQLPLSYANRTDQTVRSGHEVPCDGYLNERFPADAIDWRALKVQPRLVLIGQLELVCQEQLLFFAFDDDCMRRVEKGRERLQTIIIVINGPSVNERRGER
jgi:hypothetical protein